MVGKNSGKLVYYDIHSLQDTGFRNKKGKLFQ